jgi:hypothetical protein
MEQDRVSVWLGIDWADQKRRWATRVDGEYRIQQGELEHRPEAVDQFVSGLTFCRQSGLMRTTYFKESVRQLKIYDDIAR